MPQTISKVFQRLPTLCHNNTMNKTHLTHPNLWMNLTKLIKLTYLCWCLDYYIHHRKQRRGRRGGLCSPIACITSHTAHKCQCTDALLDRMIFGVRHKRSVATMCS